MKVSRNYMLNVSSFTYVSLHLMYEITKKS